jgi:hypothetical protein
MAIRPKTIALWSIVGCDEPARRIPWRVFFMRTGIHFARETLWSPDFRIYSIGSVENEEGLSPGTCIHVKTALFAWRCRMYGAAPSANPLRLMTTC